MSSKRANAIRAAAEKHAATFTDERTRLAEQVGFLLGAIEGLCARLDTLEYVGMRGEVAEVYDPEGNPHWVEYEYTPGSPGRDYGPPENCYPPEDGGVIITAIFCDGEPVQADGFVAQALLEKWQDELYERLTEEARDNDYAAADFAYDAAREDRAFGR